MECKNGFSFFLAIIWQWEMRIYLPAKISLPPNQTGRFFHRQPWMTNYEKWKLAGSLSELICFLTLPERVKLGQYASGRGRKGWGSSRSTVSFPRSQQQSSAPATRFLKITVLELFAIVKYFIFHFHEPRDASTDAQASFHSAWISLAHSRYSAQKWCACCNCTTYSSTGCISKLSNRSHLKNPVTWSFSSPWQLLLLDSFWMQSSWSCSEESGWTPQVKLFVSSNLLPLLQHAQGVFSALLLFKLTFLSLYYLLHKHT